MKWTTHISLCIDGALAKSDHYLGGILSSEGRLLTAKEVRQALLADKALGHQNFCGCDNRDADGSCGGHLIQRVYIAGPMTGLPDFNYPAFNAEAERLRALGFEVDNPAESKAPACGTWEGYMRLAIAKLVACDIIALLPEWNESKGACIEKRIAEDLGMGVKIASAITGLPPKPKAVH